MPFIEKALSAGFERFGNERKYSGRFELKFDLVLRDPADVKQIVDLALHLSDLAAQDRCYTREFLRIESTEIKQLDRTAHRRKWVAQLVCEDCQENVLAMIFFGQIHLQLRRSCSMRRLCSMSRLMIPNSNVSPSSFASVKIRHSTQVAFPVRRFLNCKVVSALPS